MNTINKPCIKTCNSLLRGELSAVETYRQAIEKFPDTIATPELRRILSEHRQSSLRLTENIREMGGTPETDSGAWGTFATTIQTAANLFGSKSAIESLKHGEEHGRNDYQSALGSEDVMDECKAMIRNELLPRIERHISALERLGENVGS